MRKLKWLMVFLIPIVAIGLYVINKDKTLSVKGTKVMDFISDVQILSNSDFLFETVNNKKIEIDVEDKFFKIKEWKIKQFF